MSKRFNLSRYLVLYTYQITKTSVHIYVNALNLQYNMALPSATYRFVKLYNIGSCNLRMTKVTKSKVKGRKVSKISTYKYERKNWFKNWPWVQVQMFLFSFKKKIFNHSWIFISYDIVLKYFLGVEVKLGKNKPKNRPWLRAHDFFFL